MRKKANCIVQRQGAIEDTQGGLDIEEPNYLLLVQCEKIATEEWKFPTIFPVEWPLC